jgi:hypothetical protein
LTVTGTISVELWTIGVALTGRGRRLAASATAGIEAVDVDHGAVPPPVADRPQ